MEERGQCILDSHASDLSSVSFLFKIKFVERWGDRVEILIPVLIVSVCDLQREAVFDIWKFIIKTECFQKPFFILSAHSNN